MKNKKTKIISAVIIGVLIVTGFVMWYIFIQRPHNLAVKDYNAVISVIENKNSEMEEAITKLQGLIDSGGETT